MATFLTIEQAASVVERGGVIAMPTETVYGLAGRPTHDVVSRIVELKRRPREKHMQLLVPSDVWLAELAEPNASAGSLAEAFWPGPLTLIVIAKPDAAPVALATDGSIGLRVPAHPIALELLARCGPLAASSANHSGEPTPSDIHGVAEVFGDAVDGYLDGGSISGTGSTVVDVRTKTPLVVREGPITRADVEIALSQESI